MTQKNYLPFNLEAALNGANVQTKSGKKVKVICKTRGKIFCTVYSNVASYMNNQVKYNEDGSRWSKDNPSNEDLVMV